MLVKELINSINFNDSCVNKITFSSDSIVISIDLCMWKQVGYKEGDVELREVKVIFRETTNYTWISDKSVGEIDYDTIIEINIDGKKIEIILLDEEILEKSKISILTFECIEAQLNF